MRHTHDAHTHAGHTHMGHTHTRRTHAHAHTHTHTWLPLNWPKQIQTTTITTKNNIKRRVQNCDRIEYLYVDPCLPKPQWLQQMQQPLPVATVG